MSRSRCSRSLALLLVSAWCIAPAALAGPLEAMKAEFTGLRHRDGAPDELTLQWQRFLERYADDLPGNADDHLRRHAERRVARLLQTSSAGDSADPRRPEAPGSLYTARFTTAAGAARGRLVWAQPHGPDAHSARFERSTHVAARLDWEPDGEPTRAAVATVIRVRGASPKGRVVAYLAERQRVRTCEVAVRRLERPGAELVATMLACAGAPQTREEAIALHAVESAALEEHAFAREHLADRASVTRFFSAERISQPERLAAR